MTPERWDQINEVFAAAHRLSPSERDDYLRATCGTDGPLHAAVVDLLEQDQQAEREGFLSSPCPLRRELHAAGHSGNGAGQQVGNYVLHERLGSGGMGEVYRATRTVDFSQEVALKWVKIGMGPEAIDRFRRERQLLAGLHHPNIAALLDGGSTADGVPYLVMEYIHGEPIDRYCDAQGLNFVGRARLLETVCLAVQYAHDHQVIHRDLKPSNVLVTSDGTPKLTDFGLAKDLAEDEGCTQTGAILGTPSYMAPEQAAGGTKAVGPTADVYALGAMLYHLLTGRPPFKGATVRDTLEQVAAREPVPPSRLQPDVPRDLETIALKCLEKLPARRYASPGELAADLRRSQNGEPIRARPISRLERFGRWCRRRPGVAGLTAALVAAVLGGFVAVTYLWLEARQEKHEADRQYERAEAHAKLAWDAVDDITHLAEDYFSHEPRMTDKQLALLEKALAYRLQFLRERRTDALVRFRTAQAFHFIGRVYYRMGRPGKAVDAFREQVRLLEELAAEHPDNSTYRFDQFHCYKELARARDLQERSAAAEEADRHALIIIRDLTGDFPREPLYRDALAHQVVNVASRELAVGHEEQAAAYYRESCDIARALLQELPGRRDPPAFGCNVHRGLMGLAGLAQRKSQRQEAVKAVREALAVALQIVADYPNEPDYRLLVVSTTMSLAGLLDEMGERSEAAALWDQGEKDATKLADDYPQVAVYRYYRAQGEVGLARLHWAAGRREEAERTFREAVKHLEGMISDFKDLSYPRSFLAELLTTCPVVGLRDTARAAELTKQVATLTATAPESGAR
jgi:tetratricopeptide (TPR) repeat protein